jgi:hypothetical protein
VHQGNFLRRTLFGAHRKTAGTYILGDMDYENVEKEGAKRTLLEVDSSNDEGGKYSKTTTIVKRRD